MWRREVRVLVATLFAALSFFAACSDGEERGVMALAPSHEGAKTQLWPRREVTLEDEPASCVVALGLNAVAGTVSVDVILTVVAPDGVCRASYEYGPDEKSLESGESVLLGVGRTIEDSILMYTVKPKGDAVWAEIMAGRASLELIRNSGTPEERESGW